VFRVVEYRLNARRDPYVLSRVCSFEVSVRDTRSNRTFLTHTITSKNGAVYTAVLAWNAVGLAAKHLLRVVALLLPLK